MCPCCALASTAATVSYWEYDWGVNSRQAADADGAKNANPVPRTIDYLFINSFDEFIIIPRTQRIVAVVVGFSRTG